MNEPTVKAAAAEGFGQNAADYERSRPSYPAEAVACIVGRAEIRPGRVVVDLAAGTGKLTRLLVPTGASVIAVEPVAAMREQLSLAVPGVDVRAGTAESIPLPDATVDVVTVGQALHWFDLDVAIPEVGRVLRPGGCLVFTWNTRDRSHDWVRAWGELLADGDLERPYESYYETDYGALVDGIGGFTPVERFEHRWAQPFDAELLVTRAASVSVVGALPEAERAVVLDRVRDLARTHPDLAGRQSFDFPYTTRVFWCHRI
jgi:SAM-dependent methyltransferase